MRKHNTFRMQHELLKQCYVWKDRVLESKPTLVGRLYARTPLAWVLQARFTGDDIWADKPYSIRMELGQVVKHMILTRYK